jgi:hypothetical protein
MLPDGLADRLLHRLLPPHLQLNNRRLRPRPLNHLRRLHPLRRQPRQRSNGSCFIDLATGFKLAREISRAKLLMRAIAEKWRALYHLPPQGYYDEIVITFDKGERWFCSESEARQADWRKSKV